MNDPIQLLPQNIDAERAILGTVLVHAPALFDAQSSIVASDFYFESHRIIFAALCTMQGRDTPIDLLSVKNELQSSGKLEQAGGIAYIASLSEGIPRATNVKYYAELVKESSVLRHVIKSCNAAMVRAYSGEEKSKDVIEAIQLDLLKISQSHKSKGFRASSEYVDEAYSKIEEIGKQKIALSGIDFRFEALNRLTNGLHESELIILAGRPGHGKTSFAQNVVDNLVIRRNKTVGVFSLEMSGRELVERSIYSEVPLDSYEIQEGRVEWSRLAEVCGQIGASRLYIDDSAGLTISELRARAQKLAIEHGIHLIVVDYLQLMSGSGRKSDNREREISEISRGLKVLAKDLKIPVMALSQLNREIEKTNRKPRLSDLRESGSLEQDADLVLFVWRPHVENPDDNSAQLLIAKNRHGRSNECIDMIFERKYCRFKEI